MSQDLKTDQDYLQHIRDLATDCEGVEVAFATFVELLRKDLTAHFAKIMGEIPSKVREAKLDMLTMLSKHMQTRLKELF